MLCLTRRIGERITIDGPIEVVVCEVRPGVVKLGFTGPGRVTRPDAKRAELPGPIPANNQETEE